MKKLITLCFVGICSALLFGAWVQSDNGRAGYTGSPGETDCTSCHSDYTVNTGGGGVTVTSNIPNWEYTPGQTYTINVEVQRSGNPLFGFATEILTASNDNAGTLIITNSNQTQIKTKTVSGVVRNNVVHTLGGGLTANSCVFTFDWTAPATNVGPVTIYTCGLACDNDMSTGNDYAYTSSQVITPFVQSIEENENALSFSVFPNPASEKINLNYTLKQTGLVTVNLVSLNGQLVRPILNEVQTSGKVTRTIELPENLTKGSYIVEVITGNNRAIKKIIVL